MQLPGQCQVPQDQGLLQPPATLVRMTCLEKARPKSPTNSQMMLAGAPNAFFTSKSQVCAHPVFILVDIHLVSEKCIQFSTFHVIKQ